jgi:hypothetical protein
VIDIWLNVVTVVRVSSPHEHAEGAYYLVDMGGGSGYPVKRWWYDDSETASGAPGALPGVGRGEERNDPTGNGSKQLGRDG